MRLSNAQVARILEELTRVEQVRRGPFALPGQSHGDIHRAVEDFLTIVVGEILEILPRSRP
jgi:argininosuccinate lyase